MAREMWKAKIVALRVSEPDLTYQQIADRLGCRYGTVSGACHRLGLKWGRHKSRDFGSVLKLGYAAKRVGLTLKQIEEMAHARHA
jgi:hypothetical protein